MGRASQRLDLEGREPGIDRGGAASERPDGQEVREELQRVAVMQEDQIAPLDARVRVVGGAPLPLAADGRPVPRAAGERLADLARAGGARHGVEGPALRRSRSSELAAGHNSGRRRIRWMAFSLAAVRGHPPRRPAVPFECILWSRRGPARGGAGRAGRRAEAPASAAGRGRGHRTPGPMRDRTCRECEVVVRADRRDRRAVAVECPLRPVSSTRFGPHRGSWRIAEAEARRQGGHDARRMRRRHDGLRVAAPRGWRAPAGTEAADDDRYGPSRRLKGRLAGVGQAPAPPLPNVGAARKAECPRAAPAHCPTTAVP